MGQVDPGDANFIVWEKVGETYKQAVYGASLLLITGKDRQFGGTTVFSTHTRILTNDPKDTASCRRQEQI